MKTSTLITHRRVVSFAAKENVNSSREKKKKEEKLIIKKKIEETWIFFFRGFFQTGVSIRRAQQSRSSPHLQIPTTSNKSRLGVFSPSPLSFKAYIYIHAAFFPPCAQLTWGVKCSQRRVWWLFTGCQLDYRVFVPFRIRSQAAAGLRFVYRQTETLPATGLSDRLLIN